MKIIDAQMHIWSQTVTPPSGLHRKVGKFLPACNAATGNVSRFLPRNCRGLGLRIWKT